MIRSTAVSMARAGGALALALALVPAGASPVEFSFVAPVLAGPFTGQTGTGAIRFDSASSGTLTPATHPDLEIDFSFMGQTFHQDNDSGFPDFPEVQLFDGVPVAINFVLEQGVSNVDFADASIGTISLLGVLTPADPGRLEARIDIVLRDPDVVPEPATFGLAGLALFGLALGRPRRRAPR